MSILSSLFYMVRILAKQRIRQEGVESFNLINSMICPRPDFYVITILSHIVSTLETFLLKRLHAQ